MPFDAITFITKKNAPPTAVVSYMEPTGRNGKRPADARPRLVITIPTTICGTSKAETFSLLLGNGKDAGKIRIKGCEKANKAAGIEPIQLANVFKFTFGFVPSLGEEHFEGQRCTVRKISDDEFEIDVPASWFDSEKGKTA